MHRRIKSEPRHFSLPPQSHRYHTAPVLIKPAWLPRPPPTLPASSRLSRSRADSIMVVSCSNLNLEADNGVTTAAATVGSPVSSAVDESSDKVGGWCRSKEDDEGGGSGAISSMSIGSRLSEAKGNSFDTRWLTLLVVLPEISEKNP